jgi:hypothetical protein
MEIISSIVTPKEGLQYIEEHGLEGIRDVCVLGATDLEDKKLVNLLNSDLNMVSFVDVKEHIIYRGQTEFVRTSVDGMLSWDINILADVNKYVYALCLVSKTDKIINIAETARSYLSLTTGLSVEIKNTLKTKEIDTVIFNKQEGLTEAEAELIYRPLLNGLEGVILKDNSHFDNQLRKMQEQIDELKATKKETTAKINSQNLKIISGTLSGSVNYVHPPVAYKTENLVAFIPSIRTIYFNGTVNGDDSLLCFYSLEEQSIKVSCYNSEQRATPTFNYVAIWEKK